MNPMKIWTPMALLLEMTVLPGSPWKRVNRVLCSCPASRRKQTTRSVLRGRRWPVPPSGTPGVAGTVARRILWLLPREPPACEGG